MTDIVCDIAIVGSGPAGIAAATALSHAGIKNIIVFEREPEPGGIPRHIHHPTFGLIVYHRPMSGPKFITKILSQCTAVKFELNTSVTAIKPDGILTIATVTGLKTVQAKHIILATGAREKPRHSRLISGLRPQGILTAGALQKFIYGERLAPFKRPVIVGTELASFSALSTLKSSGAKAVAMVEKTPRITAYRPAMGFAALMGTPILYNSHIVDIGGQHQVEYVSVKCPKGLKKIECDGVIFNGDFVGETALTKGSHLQYHPDSNLPLVDQNWISSDPQISIIGNSMHPADMGDQCYIEGLEAGKYIASQLAKNGAETPTFLTEISHGVQIKTTTPNAIRLIKNELTHLTVHLHVLEPYWGEVQVWQANKKKYSKIHRCIPARRISLKNIKLVPNVQALKATRATTKLEIKLGND